MDNLSHSVVGLAAGELIHRILPEEPQPGLQASRRRMLLTSCWLASNFPDLDLLLPAFLLLLLLSSFLLACNLPSLELVLTQVLPSRLGYQLHLRGHTHT